MKVIFLLILSISSAQAAGYEQGPLSSLLLPALNFGAVAAFLLFALRNPLRNMFKKQAEDVIQLYYHAEEKEKEAKIKLSMYQEKMASIESDKRRIQTQSAEELKALEGKIQEETSSQLVKLETDAKSKMAYERDVLVKQLNESLLDEVIKKTKATVTADSSLKKTITTKLANEVRS